MNGFVQLIKNLCYLSKFSLKERHRALDSERQNLKIPRIFDYEDVLEDILYKIPCDKIKRPKIYTREEALKVLQKSDYSIARFGDGEITVVEGGDIPFQKYDERLAQKLKEILTVKNDKLLVGINRFFFHYYELQGLNPLFKEFNVYQMPLLRKKLEKYINYDWQYACTEVTSRGDEAYYNEFRKIWENKPVLIVCCENAKNKIENDIYDNASKRDYLFVPNKNAFDVYDEVLNEITSKYDKNTLILLMAGPTADAWALDLCKSGYRALDLGHLPKGYDYVKRNVEMTAEEAAKYFAPD